jgi:two-component system, LuxR family, sensor kinase FixL
MPSSRSKYWTEAMTIPENDVPTSITEKKGFMAGVLGNAHEQERAFLIALATEDTIWDWDLKTDLLEFSAKVAKFGFDDWASNPTIKWWEDHIHPDDREATLRAVSAAIDGGKKSFSVEYRFCKADGDFAYIYDRAYIMHDENGVAIRAVGAMIDVTELRMVKQSLQKTENQLALAYRLNAMGTMGSMIAHELNQPLTAVANYIRASRRLAVSENPADIELMHEALEAAEMGALRAGDIIRRLREMVAQRNIDQSETSLAQLIVDVCAIALEIESAKSIRLWSTVEPPDLAVWVDPVPVQQVILNLIRNSVDALENIDRPEISIRAIKRGKFAEISVQDNGGGVPELVRNNLFSAVMTKKATGMGIGLSISRTIIEAKGGEIWLETSDPGHTEFRFTLPLFRPEMADQ